MTFAAYETATETGQPIELYEFRIGAESFFYTNNQVSVTVASLTYAPLPIARDKLTKTAESNQKEGLTVELPGDNPFVRKYVSIAPGKRATMTLKKLHRPDVAVETVVQYKGVVQSVTFTENCDKATLMISPLTAAKSRPIPRLTYQSLCGHMLYDARCKILETDPDFEKFLLVEAVTDGGRVLQLDDADTFGFADFFVNGFVEYQDDFRLITAQSGELCTLLLPFGTSPISQVVRVLAGCKHRISEDCFTRYDNVVNFGGFPFVPTKNIFVTGLD